MLLDIKCRYRLQDTVKDVYATRPGALNIKMKERFIGTVSVISSDHPCKDGKGTVLNRSLISLQIASLKITLTIPLKDLNDLE